MKRSWAGAIGGVLTLVAVAACGGGGADGSGDEGVKLRVTDIYALEHAIGKNGIQPYMERVKEESGGRITFEYFPSESLIAGEDAPGALRSGTADIANVLYLGAENPLLYVAQLPGVFEDSEVVPASEALMEFSQTNEDVQEKFDSLGMRPLFCFTVTNYQLQFAEDGVDTFDDLQGRQIRAAGAVLPFSIEAINATAVDVDIAEAFDAFNRGTIDGIALSVPSAKAYGFYDILKSAIINVDLGGFPVCYAISKDTWDSLSTEDQEILTSAGDEIVPDVSEALEAELDADLAAWAEKGIETYEIDEAERDRLLDGVADQWVSSLVSDGVPREVAQGGVDQWSELVGKHRAE